MAEGFGIGLISTSFVKTLGKTLCLCMIAIAMDLVWGFCGILSLGHFAFFALGGYMIGMWMMIFAWPLRKFTWQYALMTKVL